MSSRAELDNFVLKFHQLRSQGITAHLELDTHAGQAWVGLKVMLGNVQQQHHPNSKPSRNRSPSYFRRQERRKAARAADAESQTVNAEEAQTKSSDSLTAVEASKAKIDTEKASKDLREADKASETQFMCELCDFVSNRESGYKIHMSRKHATIEQLDGNIEDVNDSKYSDEMWSKELEENDEFIENYLMTGELDCCEAIETLQFVLSPYSLQSKSLSSKQRGLEVLHLLDKYQRLIDAERGPGAFLECSPWRDLVG